MNRRIHATYTPSVPGLTRRPRALCRTVCRNKDFCGIVRLRPTLARSGHCRNGKILQASQALAPGRVAGEPGRIEPAPLAPPPAGEKRPPQPPAPAPPPPQRAPAPPPPPRPGDTPPSATPPPAGTPGEHRSPTPWTRPAERETPRPAGSRTGAEGHIARAACDPPAPADPRPPRQAAIPAVGEPPRDRAPPPP